MFGNGILFSPEKKDNQRTKKRGGKEIRLIEKEIFYY